MKSTTETTNLPKKRGIYLLPNLFTLAALFSGFYSIVAAMKGSFQESAIAIFIALILDGLDGRIARLTNTQTHFGAELDSLSDMVCFGAAPALVAYSWALGDLGKTGWLAAFVFTAATALRLARFNTQPSKLSGRHFQGLPCPSAAAAIAAIIWLFDDMGVVGAGIDWMVALFTTGIGLLMVSNIRYHSFKDIDFSGKVPFVAILLAVVLLILIAINPPRVLTAIFIAYILSGPILSVWGRLSRAKKPSSK